MAIAGLIYIRYGELSSPEQVLVQAMFPFLIEIRRCSFPRASESDHYLH